MTNPPHPHHPGLRPSGLLKEFLCFGRNQFSDKDGNLLKTGDLVRFEKLADTLEVIANEGADAFYRGRVAEDLIRDVREAGISTWIDTLAADGSAKPAILHQLKRLFLLRRNLDGGGLGGVQSCDDGCVERSPRGLSHVLPPTACRRSHSRLYHEHHKR